MTKPLHFEKAIVQLEELVTQLEKGELSLEEALKQFELGINLTRQCQEMLHSAQQRVEQLCSSNDDQPTNE